MKYQKKKFINNTRANKRDADILISAAYRAFLLMGIMALRDEFGFGTSRLQRFIDKVDDVYDSYEQGYISLKDMTGTIENETGINVLRLEQGKELRHDDSKGISASGKEARYDDKQ